MTREEFKTIIQERLEYGIVFWTCHSNDCQGRTGEGTIGNISREITDLAEPLFEEIERLHTKITQASMDLAITESHWFKKCENLKAQLQDFNDEHPEETPVIKRFSSKELLGEDKE